MYLQNDLIEAVPLNSSEISIPGYLGKIKRGLKEKYSNLIMEANAAPEFLLVHSSPAEDDQPSAEAE